MTDIILSLEDSRRLTGPNLFGDISGAIIDVRIKNIDAVVVTQTWEKHAKQLFERIYWHKQKRLHRLYQDGASLVITAPIDCLYAATEINEAAWQLTCNEMLQIHSEDFHTELIELIQRLKALIEDEKNPKLIAIQQQAKNHNVVFLSDDDYVSIGSGATCQIYPVDDLPDIEQINWQAVKDIPVALITGTNGKSTTVRLASSVAEAANKICGITTTDYIRVGKEILDSGDFSGPGGARTLLRHPKTEIAFLEVARGGLLRRGIGINQASTVLITNVEEDHLGQYGINSLSDMVETKFIVRQAINKQQNLILNADDAGCVSFAKTLDNTILWFSWYVDNPVIQQHLKNNGSACYVEDETIYYQSAGNKQEVIHINDVPITLNGAAKHNIHNVLAVVALSFSMGFNKTDIATGLNQFSNSAEENPGRGNLFKRDGYKVIVDFAHNSHGLRLMSQTIKNIQAKRRLIMLGQPGDRSNEDIECFVKAAMLAEPDQLIICESEYYLRGRKLGEVPDLIHKFALQQGMQTEQLSIVKDSIKGTELALEWAEQEDLLLLLVFDNRNEVFDLLKETK